MGGYFETTARTQCHQLPTTLPKLPRETERVERGPQGQTSPAIRKVGDLWSSFNDDPYQGAISVLTFGQIQSRHVGQGGRGAGSSLASCRGHALAAWRAGHGTEGGRDSLFSGGRQRRSKRSRASNLYSAYSPGSGSTATASPAATSPAGDSSASCTAQGTVSTPAAAPTATAPTRSSREEGGGTPRDSHLRPRPRQAPEPRGNETTPSLGDKRARHRPDSHDPFDTARAEPPDAVLFCADPRTHPDATGASSHQEEPSAQHCRTDDRGGALQDIPSADAPSSCRYWTHGAAPTAPGRLPPQVLCPYGGSSAAQQAAGKPRRDVRRGNQHQAAARLNGPTLPLLTPSSFFFHLHL